MKNGKTGFTIKRIILLTFTASLLVSFACCGAVIFSNWITSSKEAAAATAVEINEDLRERVIAFMEVPYHLNDMNHKIIENGMLDLFLPTEREKFFAGVLSSVKEEIYSFSYGTTKGEYYGARRNEKGQIEIMRNDAYTGGNSWYYAIKDDLTAGALSVQAGPFDPRTRAWYKAAVEAAGPVFSPIYKHFVMNDLTVSAAWPVYDDGGELSGVLGTHLLLSDMGAYLQDAVTKYEGIAVIIEKSSGLLIANSMGLDNFTLGKDGTLERYGLDALDSEDLKKAYEESFITGKSFQKVYKGKLDNFFLDTSEIQMEGIQWILISAIPQSTFLGDAMTGMVWAALLAIVFFILSVLTYHFIMRKFLKPMYQLLRISEQLAAGDLTKRAQIIREDEIGFLAKGFNSVADKMQSLIDNLEATVETRTRELTEANLALQESKDQLRLILDSAAEAIYGIDLQGNCTFCNASCIKMLGYSSQEDLLGRNMHWQIHHTRRDGTPFLIDDCSIFRAFLKGEGSHVDEEVFFRADGTSFDVEYYSYPQIRDGKIIGAVITFMDISDRKEREAEIEYLSCHDPLTGLKNRRCLEDNLSKIDITDNLPLSIIFGDINGLKMTNDVFGHAAGDELIKKSADILQQSCRDKDTVARMGGDEFIILLPKTTGENAQKIIERIRAGFEDAHVEAIKCSISLGLDTKRGSEQPLDEIMANAENAMYRDKTMNRKIINATIIDTLLKSLHTACPREKQHSETVSSLCGEVGSALGLPETEIATLKRAGYLHDIGKIVMEKNMLSKDSLNDIEMEKMQQHSAVGYRILSLFDDTLDLAELVYGHHERWDGTGYPRGLKEKQIPLLSRIIAVVETYDRVVNRGILSFNERKNEALEVIKSGAGTQFDPEVAAAFLREIKKSAV